jgi:uncharacterized SAM-binding protein YcdF (DUF218 family)
VFLDFLKSYVFPHPWLGLVLGAIIGAFLVSVRSLRAFGQTWLVTVTVAHIGLSLPCTADHLVKTLQGSDSPLARDADLPPRASVVILDGDHAESRVRKAIGLYNQLQSPSIILSSWNPDTYQALIASGVPPEGLICESQSRTTREQAVNLVGVLRVHSIRRSVLVASPIQMRRALATLRAVGLHPFASTAELPTDWDATGFERVFPRYGALRLSEEALYEYFALGYYRARGWIR